MIKWVFDEEYRKWRTNRLAQREIRHKSFVSVQRKSNEADRNYGQIKVVLSTEIVKESGFTNRVFLGYDEEKNELLIKGTTDDKGLKLCKASNNGCKMLLICCTRFFTYCGITDTIEPDRYFAKVDHDGIIHVDFNTKV
nr:MAG TPA: hypothetical protein [Caudoviricetes sp.]